MEWSDVLDDPSLQDLPYKIELNEWGQIVMTPASNQHGYLQGEIVFQLRRQIPEGFVFPECSIATSKGVKVADVVWCPEDFIRRHGFPTPYPEAPPLCIEVLSPSNRAGEMELKRNLYFEAGAREVWLVSPTGDVALFDAAGPLDQSRFGLCLDLKPTP